MTVKNKDATYQATNWYVHLTSGEATEQDRQSWHEWLSADPENQKAWQKVESVTNRFSGLDSKAGLAVLNRPAHERDLNGRRQAIKSLGLLFMVGSASWYSYREKPWYHLLADYSTGTGEIQHVTLADGTNLVLNTNTKVAINFNGNVRNVRLLQGEIHVETGHEQRQTYRPFIVTTEHGSAQALGTQFSTRVHGMQTIVNVFADKVEVNPADANDNKIIIKAGQSVTFSSDKILKKQPIDPSASAWTKGFIIIDEKPLGEVVIELARYKTGILRCDPAVADLKISGAFPINDIDAALESISQFHPVRVESLTRFWVMLKPA